MLKPAATPVTHDVSITGESAYDTEKGGIYVGTTGATAWGSAFTKYGANYGLTDKTFSSVIVDLDFYKEGSKVSSAIDTDQCICVTVASSSTDWGTTNKEQQNYNAGSGQSTVSGTNMVANVVAFQWKKAAADLTAYDAILIKSIKLVEAAASSGETVSDATLTGYNHLTNGAATSKTFTLDDTTTAADCITAQLGTGVGKIEIESIVLTAKS